MKNLLNSILLSCFFIIGRAFAEDNKAAAKTQKYYVQIYGYSYDEPGVMNKNSSVPFIGVGAQDFGQAGRSGLIYEAWASYGETDYSSVTTGTTKGTPTYVYSGEASWLQSYKNYNIFAGLGYRYLFDDWGGQTSSTGNWGYDRKSEYVYMPFGMINYFENSGHFKVQYNYFISGTQTSYMSVGGGSNYDWSATQKSGYGYSLEYAPTKNYSFFSRYWNIDGSNLHNYLGTDYWEPPNDTLELGMKVLF